MEKNVKLTKTMILAAIEASYAELGPDEMISDEVSVADVREFINREIVMLSNKATKAKERAQKKKEEVDVLKQKIVAALTDEYKPISDIVAVIDDEDATVSKCVYRLTALIKEGIAEKEEIEVPNGDKKKRKVMGYRGVSVPVDGDVVE